RVTPDYFRAMEVRLLAGRLFDERDRTGAPPVCIVDETFAKASWPSESAVGKRVKFGPLSRTENPWMEVVGVVAHLKNYGGGEAAVRTWGVDGACGVGPALPFLQNSASAVTLAVRVDGDPGTLAAPLRAAVRAADSELPVYAIRTLAELVADRTAQRRLAVL